MIYEIEPVYWPNYPHLSEIATLTGLEFEDIKQVTDQLGKRWNGQTYINVFHKLGFNTSKFIKFDPETKYPCMLRLSRKDDSFWYVFVYNDNKLYHRKEVSFFDEVFRYLNGSYYTNLDTRIGNNKAYKITSMLQVWI